MWRESRAIITMVCVCVGIYLGALSSALFAQTKPNASGWQLGPDADTLKNPLTVDDKVTGNRKECLQGQVSALPWSGWQG